MESPAILMPTNISLTLYSTFHENPIFLKQQNIKKYQHYIDDGGRCFTNTMRHIGSYCDL